MRTKDEILNQHMSELQSVEKPSDIDRMQRSGLLEVLIDIRDIINDRLVGVIRPTFNISKH